MSISKCTLLGCFLFLAILFCLCDFTNADTENWKTQDVDWRITGGGGIKAIKYPQDRCPPLRSDDRGPVIERKKTLPIKTLRADTTQDIMIDIIDSPPIDGFVPWIVIATTNKREEELVLDAVVEDSVTGPYTAADPTTDYAIGIFDTGASAHVLSSQAADIFRLETKGLLTDNTIEITGVTGSVDAWVSYPLGLFVDGLAALEPNGIFSDDSTMVGQTNVALVVGKNHPGMPDLPNAIGTPLSVYYTTVFNIENQVVVNRDGDIITGPDVRIYEKTNPDIPTYLNKIPLELRPLGGISVQYVPDYDLTDILLDPLNITFDTPGTPSIIIGNLSQSVFFVHSVDMSHNGNQAFDKNRFMLDTGAQVSVIGSRIGARLGLNPAEPDFLVEIQGVTGDISWEPAFYIDLVEIPALGEWMRFTNVPVVLLDVASPEGGTLDGIIGMNLFVDYNFVLKGGGLFLQDDPMIEFSPILERLIGDIEPLGGDGSVDMLDLAAMGTGWLANPQSGNWNPECDIAPLNNPDGNVNMLDFSLLAENWLKTIP